MSLPQEQIVGDVNMLAVSNRLTFLGGQTNHFVAKKRKWGVRFTFWPLNCYSGMSAVGVVVDVLVPIFKILLDVHLYAQVGAAIFQFHCLLCSQCRYNLSLKVNFIILQLSLPWTEDTSQTGSPAFPLMHIQLEWSSCMSVFPALAGPR